MPISDPNSKFSLTNLIDGFEGSDIDKSIKKYGIIKTIGLAILDDLGIINGKDYVK